ncbi:MAG: hypothetical protein V2I33_22725, partial [Kangiellaceae bacterium]|nr:hypothetical protein [Kangiellaceae bacterium]
MDAAWSLFKKLKFNDAVEYFQQANFDPRDIISLFPGLCSDRIYLPNSKKDTIATLVASYI